MGKGRIGPRGNDRLEGDLFRPAAAHPVFELEGDLLLPDARPDHLPHRCEGLSGNPRRFPDQGYLPLILDRPEGLEPAREGLKHHLRERLPKPEMLLHREGRGFEPDPPDPMPAGHSRNPLDPVAEFNDLRPESLPPRLGHIPAVHQEGKPVRAPPSGRRRRR